MIKEFVGELFQAIWDRNLYGKGFLFRGILYIFVGLIVQYYTTIIFYDFIPTLLYLTIFFILFFLLGMFSKNVRKQYHFLQWEMALIMLFTSIFGKGFSLIIPLEYNLFGFFKRLLIISIAEIGLLYSLSSIVVHGQRRSLRESIGLDEKIFPREINRWKSMLKDFPNSDEMIKNINEGNMIPELFDRGFFNITILWSCALMEKIVDTIVEGILLLDRDEKISFFHEDGRRKTYPIKLKNIGYTYYNYKNNKKFNEGILWHKLRNKIVHYNYIPNYYETRHTIKLLLSFLKEIPLILQKWTLK